MLSNAELQSRIATLLYPIDPQVDPWHSASAPTLVFSYSFAAAQPPDLTVPYSGWAVFSDAEKASVRSALAELSAVINVQFVELASAGTADFDFGRVDLSPGVAGEGGFGYGYSTQGSTVVAKDWQGFAVFDKDENLLDQDGTQLLLHEIGHALGLKHPGDYNAGGGGSPAPYLPAGEDNNKYSVMSYNLNPTNGKFSDNLMVYDIAALQARWGANLTSHAGNDSYTAPEGGRIQAIWDAGGIDTIDGSAQSTRVAIDLRAGNFSTVGASDNFIIAYGVTIENAIGGSWHDSLIGNDAANTLSGGAGQDFIQGNGGADILVGGPDRDTFYFALTSDSTTAAPDKIVGFERDGDTIDISALSPTAIAFVQFGGSMVMYATTPQGAFQLDIDGTVAGQFLNSGGVGADFVGDASANALSGTASSDRLFGGPGDDTLFGYGGADILVGNEGADTFAFNQSDVSLDGAKRDVIWDFETGRDRIDLSGIALTAVSVVRAGGSTFVFANSSEVGISLLPGKFGLGVTGIVQGSDLVFSRMGADFVGGADAELLIGTARADRIFGGDGNDYLRGGGGADILVGNAGADVFQFTTASDSTSTASDNIWDFLSGTDRIDLTGLLANQGSFQAGLSLVRQGGGTLLFANTASGAFQLGVAQFMQGSDVDTGGLGLDLVGQAGDETLVGTGGQDRLFGLGGNDILIGGAGGDSLQGGAGADIFRIQAASESVRTPAGGTVVQYDIIYDFDSGIDKLDLRGTGITGLVIAQENNALSVSGTGPAGEAFHLWVATAGGHTITLADILTGPLGSQALMASAASDPVLDHPDPMNGAIIQALLPQDAIPDFIV